MEKTQAKETVVLALGVFDLFHRGHLEFLRKARARGDRLVVAVNTDEKVAQYKRRPVISTEDRLAIVEAVRFVDQVDVSDSFSISALVEKHAPDIIVHGDDWTRERYLEQIGLTDAELDRLGLRLELVPYHKGASTSAIISGIEKAA